MKSGKKLLSSVLALSLLVACGGDEEEVIVYPDSPFELPLTYALSEDDTAPVFYQDVFDYITNNVVPAIETTAEDVVLSKDEEKALEAETERLQAANDLLAIELEKENARLGSIILVSVTDPSEKNNDALAAASEEYAEMIANVPSSPDMEQSEEESEEGETEKPLSNTTETSVDISSLGVVAMDEITYLQKAEILPFIYTYDLATTGVSGGEATAGYAKTMASSGFKVVDAFHPMDDEYYELLDLDYTQRAGTVTFAKKATGTDRLLMVTVDWHSFGATVTVEYRDGTIWVAPPSTDSGSTSRGSLTISDAVEFLESSNPTDLGLSGTSMESYNIYTAEALVMIDGVSYRQFNVSEKAADGNGNVFAGSYLINSDGDTYRVDPVSGAVYPTAMNVFDYMD